MQLDVNFCKDHRDKTEVPDPLAVENLINYKLNNRRKLARLITQYGNIFSNISKGTAFFLQGVTFSDGHFAIQEHSSNIKQNVLNGCRVY